MAIQLSPHHCHLAMLVFSWGPFPAIWIPSNQAQLLVAQQTCLQGIVIPIIVIAILLLIELLLQPMPRGLLMLHQIGNNWIPHIPWDAKSPPSSGRWVCPQAEFCPNLAMQNWFDHLCNGQWNCQQPFKLVLVQHEQLVPQPRWHPINFAQLTNQCS